MKLKIISINIIVNTAKENLKQADRIGHKLGGGGESLPPAFQWVMQKK